MSVALIGLGLLLLLVPHLEPAVRRVDPDRWARRSAAACRRGLRMVQLGLVLAALPTALRALGVHQMADACHRIASPFAPGSLAGWLTAVLCGIVAVRALTGRVRAHQSLRAGWIESTLGRHQDVPVDGTVVELVALPSDRWLAYSVPGSPPQIVLTDGVLAALSVDELGAVVGHEAAHLARGHHRMLLGLAEVDAGLGRLPGVRGATTRARHALERSADHDAVARTGAGSLSSALAQFARTMTGARDAVADRRVAIDAPMGRSRLQSVVATGVPLGFVAVAALTIGVGALTAQHGVLGIVGLCTI